MKKFSKNKWVNSIRGAFFYFFDREKIDENLLILSVSCGDGCCEKLIFKNYKNANVIGTDVVDCMINEEDIKFFNKNGKWNFVRLEPEKELPFESNSFDLVFSTDVIEHVENPMFFLKEQFQALKPGGGIIVGTPNLFRPVNIAKALAGKLNFPKKINNEKLYTSSHHLQEFDEWNLRGMLKEAGFEKIEFKYSYFGFHFLNLCFKEYPVKGMGRIMCHYLTAYAKKPLA